VSVKILVINNSGCAYIGHRDNDDMFLVVELARSEIEFETKEVPFAVWHDEIPATADWVRDQLDNIGRDSDARVAQ